MISNEFERQGFRARLYKSLNNKERKFVLYRLYDERSEGEFIGVEVFLVKRASQDQYAFGKKLLSAGEEYIDKGSVNAAGVSVWYFSQASNSEPAEEMAEDFVNNFEPNRYFVRNVKYGRKTK